MPVSYNHALVLDPSGTHFFCCGNNDQGQLGTGDQNPLSIFTQVNLPVKFTAICAGYQNHSLGISATNGSLWSWGSNAQGQLGLGSQIKTQVHPSQFPNTQQFLQICAGNQFSLGLDSQGRVWAFGKNSHGQLGLGDQETRYVPSVIQSLQHITQISAGYRFGMGLDHLGNLWSFGSNSRSQLGVGTQLTEKFLVQLNNFRISKFPE